MTITILNLESNHDKSNVIIIIWVKLLYTND